MKRGECQIMQGHSDDAPAPAWRQAIWRDFVLRRLAARQRQVSKGRQRSTQASIASQWGMAADLCLPASSSSQAAILVEPMWKPLAAEAAARSCFFFCQSFQE